MEWNDNYKKGAIILSVIILVFSIIYVTLYNEFIPSPPFWIPISQEINSVIGLCLFLSILPIAVTQFLGDRWLDSVDQNVPRFLQDVTEDVKSGQSLIVSLEENAKEDYGSITVPLQNALSQFKFTADLARSMNWLGDKLKRPVAKQMTSIFIEAYSAGGRVSEILQSSVTLFRSIDENRQDRRIKTRPYVIVVYVSLGIFLVVSWVILNRFLIPMNTHTQTFTDASGFNLRLLEMSYYRSILFWTALAESLIGGLIAGKISKGKVASGFIHSVILILSTLCFFTFIM
jgi:flagellar protein FlaJ